jgi:hypothetical protein
MLMHNPTPLEISIVRIVFISHLLLPLCPEQLVSPSVGSLLEAIGITETELPPQLSTHLSQVAFRKIFRLIGLHGLFLEPDDFLITGASVLLLG